MHTQTKHKYSGKRYRLKKPELLAPAGNLEKLKFAIHYGADAVYIGGQKYGLRSNADNFNFEEMHAGVEFAKKYGAKVFVATNIYAHNEDIAGLENYLRNVEHTGVSAIIAADPFIIETAQHVAPKLEVHVSTQQSIANWKTIQFWKNEGIPRVVLARETSLDEIQEMKNHVNIEIEAFIHGAMCSSYSGRCVLSNHFTDRDSNRGGCCQSCRWKYDLLGVNQKALSDEEDNAFAMSAKDLCMIEHLPDLIDVGVDSLKIEGRMKSIHYVATVVHIYRKAIDAYIADPDNYRLKQQWLDEIYKAANRPLNTGFFYKEPDHKDHIYEPEDKLGLYDFAGLVIDCDAQTAIATIQQRNHFKVGMEVEFFGPKGTFFKQTVAQLWDMKGNELDAARHPLQLVRVKVNQPVTHFDMMRKKNAK